MLEKKRYAYTTAADLSALTPAQTVPYAYGDAGWKDKLTSFDGKPITHDTIGNPLTYDGWAYTWKAGRMLHSMARGGENPVTAQFTYDHTGLRVKKTVNRVDTFYTLNGKKITHIRKGTNGAAGADAVQMHFFYDAQGRPMLVRYVDVDYAYLHNLQGDVVGIVDMNGVPVVEYGYDAWGKPVFTEGSMAETLGKDNPFRYRGYVWDEETGLYYLRSRYYDPCWGRFINADNAAVATRLGVRLIHGHNLYAYCFGRPINMSDNSGDWPQWVTDSLSWVAGAASDAWHWTAQAATDVGAWTVQAAINVGNAVHEGFQFYGQAVEVNVIAQTQAINNIANWTKQTAANIGCWVKQVANDFSNWVTQVARSKGGQIATNLAAGVWGTYKSLDALSKAAAVSLVPPLAAPITVPVATGFVVKASYHYARAAKSFSKAINSILSLIIGGKK